MIETVSLTVKTKGNTVKGGVEDTEGHSPERQVLMHFTVCLPSKLHSVSLFPSKKVTCIWNNEYSLLGSLLS